MGAPSGKSDEYSGSAQGMRFSTRARMPRRRAAVSPAHQAKSGAGQRARSRRILGAIAQHTFDPLNLFFQPGQRSDPGGSIIPQRFGE